VTPGFKLISTDMRVPTNAPYGGHLPAVASVSVLPASLTAAQFLLAVKFVSRSVCSNVTLHNIYFISSEVNNLNLFFFSCRNSSPGGLAGVDAILIY
jgi:hypothetical protein